MDWIGGKGSREGEKKRRGKKVESGIKLMIIQKGEERAKEVIQEMATVK